MMPSPQSRYLKATGYWAAAWLLWQIAYWWPRATKATMKDGSRAIAKSAGDWCADTGLTPQQYKDAVHKLRKCGLVRTEQGFFGTYGHKSITHMTLTNAGQALIKKPKNAP